MREAISVLNNIFKGRKTEYKEILRQKENALIRVKNAPTILSIPENLCFTCVKKLSSHPYLSNTKVYWAQVKGNADSNKCKISTLIQTKIPRLLLVFNAGTREQIL